MTENQNWMLAIFGALGGSVLKQEQAEKHFWKLLHTASMSNVFLCGVRRC